MNFGTGCNLVNLLKALGLVIVPRRGRVAFYITPGLADLF